ncbi:MAG: GIY-YIG nuclease family protein [Gammaproteobacteria bacterium]
MTTIDNFLKAVDRYIEKYRRTDVPSLSIGQLYDLKPDDATHGPGWPDEWPNSERAGVYAIFDEDRQLLYVGKASMSNYLYARLGEHFYSDENRSCRIRKQKWKEWKFIPKYVLTVGVPDTMKFEAPAIEEYLIWELNPTYNGQGKR